MAGGSREKKKPPQVAVDWSSLPADLVGKVATKIDIISDYVRFRTVCKPWRSSTSATPSHDFLCQPPWLFQRKTSDLNCLSFVEVAADNKRRHDLRLPEPLNKGRRCRGSSHGWLVILDESPSAVILNPITGAKLNLPPLSTLPPVERFDGCKYYLHSEYSPWRNYSLKLEDMRDSFIQKIILSGCPIRNPNFTAVAIFNGSGPSNLACCRSGQDRWTEVPISNVSDAVYFQGMVYAVDALGLLFAYDINGESPEVEEVKMVSGNPLEEGFFRTFYLVSARDELLFVAARYVDSTTRRMSEVFRLISCESGSKDWERVEDLGDRALFIGHNSCSSAVIKASSFPGCPANSICYAPDDEYDDDRMRYEDDDRMDYPTVDHSPNPSWLIPNPFNDNL